MRYKSFYIREIILVHLLMGMTFSLYSQQVESLVISKLSSEDGLSSNTIYSILQDNSGFIWIATEQGLNKYDGKNLTHFDIQKSRHQLSHNRNQTMILAPDGNIWTGTSDGLNIYDYQLDSIIQVRTDTKPLKLIYNDITYLSLSYDKSKVWIGTYGNGVNYINWSTKECQTLPLPQLANVPEPRYVMSLLEDDNNRLWIGTRNNGLYRYSHKNNKMEYFQLPENGRFIRVIYQDSFRRIWIGTSKGCYLYNETTNRLDPVVFPGRLVDNSIGAIQEDRNGRLWIGTEQFLSSFSVREFSMNEKFDYQIIEHGESSSRLNCPSINSLFADLENNIWIGTAWGGVNKLKGSKTKFILFKHESDQENSLPNSPVMAICSNNSNRIYAATMGTDEISLYALNITTGAITELPLNKRFPECVYQSVFIDSNENLWLGTYNQGLIKSSVNSSRFQQFVADPSISTSIQGNDVRAIFESKDKTVWIGTDKGLSTYSKTSNLFKRIELSEESAIPVRALAEDSTGVLWIGTYGAGIVTYDPVNGESNLNPIPVSPHTVPDICINKNEIWIASNGEGLFNYDVLTKTSKRYTISDGLASNYTYSVLCDDSANVWIGHSKGISKFNPGSHEFVNFNSGDGLQPREFSARGAIKLHNGQMAFAGYGGINIFDPSHVTKDDKCPQVVFTKLLINNEPITPNESSQKHTTLKKNITLSERIDLWRNQSVFTIEFMGINYNANPKIQYAYLLEGSDKTWNYIGPQNNVTFRNLRAGEYKLSVKASSPDAVWTNQNIKSLTIVVHPPFWASVWAYLIYSVLLLVLFYFVGLFIIIRIESANKLKIERAQREKDEELHQEKIQFFTNISHELRTPLTLVIGPLENMYDDETEYEKKINIKLMLHNAKRLMAMVNQLLDFRKTEKGQMKLKVQYANIIDSLREVMISYEDLGKQKKIKFNSFDKEEKVMAWFDPEFINKALFNLLSNAFKYTLSGGTIFVAYQITTDVIGNKMLSISVSDNGKGISKDELPFVFDRFYQGEEKTNLQLGTGIGLHLVKNLIELHHGTIEVESTPNFQTTFKLTIPMERSAYLKEEILDQYTVVQHQSLSVPDYLNVNEAELHEHETVKKDTRKRILIVEDNADIRNYIKNTLGSKYAIEEAENGKLGWELILLHEFDLVVSDLMMPEMDGIEMCKLMKSSVETDHIPIIMLTAKSDIENRIEGLSIGADSYITKPFHPKHLTVRVSKLIELRDLLKERYSRKIMLGEISSKPTHSDSPEEIFLQKAVSIVMEKMMESEFNGDSLASDLNISRMGLHRKIKALTGQTTGEFIRNLRLKKAHELLSSDGKNVSEVCYEVGFNSPSYFTTCFTDVYKMTPSEYIRSLK